MLQDLLFGIAAAGVCFLITPAIRRGAIWLGTLDEPGGRRIHTGRVPRLGGLAVLIAFTGAFGVGVLVDPSLGVEFVQCGVGKGWLLAGFFVIVTTGVVDDLWDLPPKTKLAMECGAGMLALVSGVQISALVNPFTGDVVLLGWLSLPLTLLWIVGITNAFNLIDGLDGLAAGVALIAAVTVWLIASTTGQGDLAMLAITLAGALAGFLFYNFHPAAIFLGDSGSLFLGYLLSIVSVEAARTEAAEVRIVVLVVIFGLPITDLLLAATRRFAAPFRETSQEATIAQLFRMGCHALLQPDRDHIHHRLLSQGFSHRQAVLVLYGGCVLSGGTAFVLLNREGLPVSVGAAVIGLLVYLGVRKLGYY